MSTNVRARVMELVKLVGVMAVLFMVGCFIVGEGMMDGLTFMCFPWGFAAFCKIRSLFSLHFHVFYFSWFHMIVALVVVMFIAVWVIFYLGGAVLCFKIGKCIYNIFREISNENKLLSGC